jgi:GDSL-like Lipase/Acylhydrolase family
MMKEHLVGEKMLLVLLGLALALGAAEGLLRAFPALLPLEVQIALENRPETRGIQHAYIGNLHPPNDIVNVRTRQFHIAYPTDTHGFNNRDPWPPTADIVAIGDSLTFGYGVPPDEAWPALIGRALPDTAIINLGLIGAGPQQYLRVYETFGIPLQPKILLLGFFVTNDFWDAEMFDSWLKSKVGGNYMVWRDFGRKTGDRSSSLHQALRASHLYKWATFIREVYRTWRAGEPKTLQLAGGGQVQLSPSHIARMTANIEPDHPVFELVIGALERMHAIATSHGTQMIVVLQPGKEETYLPLLNGTNGDLDGATTDPGAPLRAALEERGIEYLDLLPVFREHAKVGAKLFYEIDGHPNLEGYRLIAEQVLAYFEAQAERYGLATARRWVQR